MTLEEYAKSNYRFLNQYQAMLFISNGAEIKGTYVSHNSKNDEYKMVYVFEKNAENENLLMKFRNHNLIWGDNVIKFEIRNI